jgi:para-nitrobenzyl esterase
MDCNEIGKLIGSEDCLYLNIWRPQNDDKDLPVFFWVHGGANVTGMGSLNLYNGVNFAAMNNIVVVTINYRLGPLGWFAHPSLKTGDALDDSGNYGTLDIIRALTWVRDNIASFGGDPNNVTVAGESAGSMNMYSLLASPLAKGLFHRGLSESGGPIAGSMNKAYDQAGQLACELMVKDGTAASMEGARSTLRRKDDSWIRQYLRSKSAAEIYSCYEENKMGMLQGASQIFIDGTVLPMNLHAAYMRGDYNKVPLLLGANKEELKTYLTLILTNMTEQDLCEFSRDIDPNNPGVKPTDIMSPLRVPLYPPLGWVSGAVMQWAGADNPASIMSMHQDDIYVYKFAWKDEPPPLDYIIGAAHGLEIPFVFGNFQSGPDSMLRFAWSEENKEGREGLSRIIMTYWGNFARTGNPNGPGLPEWEQWSNLSVLPKRKVLNIE